MQFSKSNIIVNDVWKPVLIITDSVPIPAFPNNVVIEENEYFTTNYYTDGEYRSFEENNNYINWYLINGQEVKEKLTARIENLEKQTSTLDETAITLFEENEKLKQSQAEQDDSIIALYENIGGTKQ